MAIVNHTDPKPDPACIHIYTSSYYSRHANKSGVILCTDTREYLVPKATRPYNGRTKRNATFDPGHNGVRALSTFSGVTCPKCLKIYKDKLLSKLAEIDSTINGLTPTESKLDYGQILDDVHGNIKSLPIYGA